LFGKSLFKRDEYRFAELGNWKMTVAGQDGGHRIHPMGLPASTSAISRQTMLPAVKSDNTKANNGEVTT